MASPSVHQGDHHFAGNVTFRSLEIPDDTIDEDAIDPNAEFPTSIMNHRFHCGEAQSGNAAAATKKIFTAYGDATIISVKMGSIVAATGDSTATIDVKANGTTILSAPIVLNSANTAYVTVAGTISDTTITAGQVLTVVITVSAGSGTLPTGLFVEVVVDEEPLP